MMHVVTISRWTTSSLYDFMIKAPPSHTDAVPDEDAEYIKTRCFIRDMFLVCKIYYDHNQIFHLVRIELWCVEYIVTNVFFKYAYILRIKSIGNEYKIQQ